MPLVLKEGQRRLLRYPSPLFSLLLLASLLREGTDARERSGEERKERGNRCRRRRGVSEGGGGGARNEARIKKRRRGGGGGLFRPCSAAQRGGQRSNPSGVPA